MQHKGYFPAMLEKEIEGSRLRFKWFPFTIWGRHPIKNSQSLFIQFLVGLDFHKVIVPDFQTDFDKQIMP